MRLVWLVAFSSVWLLYKRIISNLPGVSIDIFDGLESADGSKSVN
jgi:hypothetical protein